ncbi:transposase [Streptomyces sp. NBC_01604]|uniref:transposase n=1 Tax=Streptomyces sp. NBC_01604 TaxID=2975894 RepID=UPI0038641646
MKGMARHSTDFPSAHWKKIWSTNPLERLNPGDQTAGRRRPGPPQPRRPEPVRRRVLAEVHDEWQVFDRRYLSEASMAEVFTTKPIEPEPQITPQPDPKQLP